MIADRRRFLKRASETSAVLLLGGGLLSARFVQRAHARHTLTADLLSRSLPVLNRSETDELSTLPPRAHDEIRRYFHGVCLNVHGFAEHICSNGFAVKLAQCAGDEQKHALLNVAFSQTVATGTIAREVGVELDRNWSTVCEELNDSWKLALKPTSSNGERLDLLSITDETILQSLNEARAKAYPVGQRPAISQPIAEIGMAAILLLPVAVFGPEVAFPLFVARALSSAWSFVLGRLAHRAADYQLAISEHLSVLGNRVASECEREIRNRIADLHTFQQRAIELAATTKAREIIGTVF